MMDSKIVLKKFKDSLIVSNDELFEEESNASINLPL